MEKGKSRIRFVSHNVPIYIFCLTMFLLCLHGSSNNPRGFMTAALQTIRIHHGGAKNTQVGATDAHTMLL